MSEIQIIKLVFGLFLGIGGAVLILLAFPLGYRYLIQEKRCTAKTMGIVHHYRAELPVVIYQVNGRTYRVKGPEYQLYVMTSRQGAFQKNRRVSKEKGQILFTHETSNAFAAQHRSGLEERYPLHSEIPVYYDPQNPQLAYVLRYCNKKWLFYLMFGTGLAIWILDCIIQFTL